MERSVAVVGAGLTGLVAAMRLAEGGRRVEVFERWPAAGGLVATFEVEGEAVECFYHHLFTTDTAYLRLAEELGLAREIDWLPSRMGIWSRNRLWDFGTPASLLRFGPLPLLDKARFAVSTLKLRQSSSLDRFEGVTAREWVLRHAGRRVWETVWGPLLEQKFAERADEVSMAWLWRKVYLRGRSRSGSGMDERLGYMRGGFGRLVAALEARLGALGVPVHTADPVHMIRRDGMGLEVTVRQHRHRFDEALFTGSPEELLRTTGAGLPAEYVDRLRALPATAALCAVLELDRHVTPYYWINVADSSFPFGGVIEHTNLIPPERYGGRHILYVSNYLFAGHPLWSARDEVVWATYEPFLERLAPALSQAKVLGRHVFRAAYAQPVIPIDYSRRIPPFSTPIRGLYHCCMAQIYPEDRGQNYAVANAEAAARALLDAS